MMLGIGLKRFVRGALFRGELGGISEEAPDEWLPRRLGRESSGVGLGSVRDEGRLADDGEPLLVATAIFLPDRHSPPGSMS